jgi:hypothetical protein
VVENIGTWSRIWKSLPNYDKSITDSSFRLKRNYEKHLLDLEQRYFDPKTNTMKDVEFYDALYGSIFPK